MEVIAPNSKSEQADICCTRCQQSAGCQYWEVRNHDVTADATTKAISYDPTNPALTGLNLRGIFLQCAFLKMRIAKSTLRHLQIV